ncbi:hypothetical protein TrCOL_g3776 [Triparma columacea]|uniref:Uncharacterized protein n=1 Tax=Triparma columacea TaxID=722753 RepID=A0A9W7L7P3_9STRA|nr:hypothetical protein TrCOL_g3776 [Triparma columacea]
MLAASLPALSTSFAATSSSLKGLQDSLWSKINARTPLKDTDFASAFGASEYGQFYDEVSPQYLTGVTKYTIGSTHSLDCWMGPSNDIPNSLLSFGEDEDGTFSLTCDMVTRGSTPIGSDPQMIEKYYAPAMAWASAASSQGKPLPPPTSFNSRVVSSPLRVSVGGLSFENVETLANEHVDRWCSYVEDCQPIAARLRGGFNARDDKLRQYFYRGKVEEYTALFGEEEGRTMAAISTGPISEAYVGGGS